MCPAGRIHRETDSQNTSTSESEEPNVTLDPPLTADEIKQLKDLDLSESAVAHARRIGLSFDVYKKLKDTHAASRELPRPQRIVSSISRCIAYRY